MRLSKAAATRHAEAEALVAVSRDLTLDERKFILAHWDPSAQHINSIAGAFFTPPELADAFAHVLGDGVDSVIDLCAGIGGLSFPLVTGRVAPQRIVCVEKNPDYVRVGRKVLPEALWIEADVFDAASLGLGTFGWAISNPPFGKAPGRKGKVEHAVVLAGMSLAEFGQFILPQMSAGFRYSGQDAFTRDTAGSSCDFQQQHGLRFGPTSVDTDFARSLWKGTAPVVEVVFVERDTGGDA